MSDTNGGLNISLEDLPRDKVEELATIVVERVLNKDIQKKISKSIQEEFEQISVENITQIAQEVLGQDYWEIMTICRHLRERKVDSKETCDQILMALGGYYTPVSAACGILWSQHKEQW